MILFDCLPLMTVSRLMVSVSFYANAFVWAQGASKSFPPLTIIDGALIEFNLYFRIMQDEFVQTYDGTDDTMYLCTIDAIDMGPCGNFQGGIRRFSIATGRILECTWSNVEARKMPINAIKCVKYVAKGQKEEKGLKFGDRKN